MKVDSIELEEYPILARSYQLIVDIEGQQPEPAIGWSLVGASLVPPSPSSMDPLEYVRQFVYRPAAAFLRSIQEQATTENITMGITALGKTYDVVAFFSNPITLPGKTRKVSLKTAYDLNSLDVIYALLSYYIENPDEYSDLAPYITEARLTAWRSSILTFMLG